MFVVRIFQNLGGGEGVRALEGIIVESRCAENVIRLLEKPVDLRTGYDNFWLARKVGEDVGSAILGILEPSVSSCR